MAFTVCVTTEYDREVIAPALAQLPPEARVTFGPEVGRDLTRDEVLAAAADAGAVIASSEAYDADLFAALPGLRMVTRDGVGYNAVDLEAATEHGVLVTNAPVMHIATANFAMGMITALVRRILVADRETRNRGWTRRELFLAPGMDAMTLGVVGYGNIGRGVAQRALAHGMRVLAFSRGLTARAGAARRRDAGAGGPDPCRQRRGEPARAAHRPHTRHGRRGATGQHAARQLPGQYQPRRGGGRGGADRRAALRAPGRRRPGRVRAGTGGR